VSIDYVLNRPPEPLLHEPQATPALSLSDEEYDLIIDYRKMSRKGQNRTRELVDEMLTLYPSRL